MSFLGTWAGQNIVCIGHNCRVSDYSWLPRMFIDDDKKFPAQLCDGVHEQYDRIIKPGSLSQPLYRSIWFHRSFQRSDRLLIEDALEPKLSRFYPADRPWILRNLTTKEFVRSGAIAPKPEYIHGPITDRVGFGEVVLWRTYGAMWNREIPQKYWDMPKKSWSGHAFDIVPLQSHTENTKGEEWKDSSDEVGKEMAEL